MNSVRLAATLLLAAGLLAATVSGDRPAPAFGASAPPAGHVGGTLPPDRTTLWSRLSRVRLVEDNDKTKPDFDPSVTALDNTALEISGFIMPLEQGEKQKHFLISAYPQGCPFCSPFGPEGLVEVVCKQPVGLTFKAITLKGKFTLLRNYDETGLFYRLVDAELVGGM